MDIKRDNLIRPAFAYRIISVKSKSDGVIELQGGSHLYAPLLCHRLARSAELAFGVATIGHAIAESIDRLFKTGRQLQAVLLEEIANACLYKVSGQFQRRIDDVAAKLNQQASGMLAPGDAGFELDQQARVLALAGASAIDVDLSASGMMQPRHCVSHVIGLGRRMRKWTRIENCSVCSSRERCPYRQAAAVLSA